MKFTFPFQTFLTPVSFYSFWIRHESLTSFFLSESNFLGIHRFSILWRKQWRMWQGVCRYKGRAEMSVSVRVPPPPGRANLSGYFEIILKFLKLNILYMYCMYYIWKLSNFEVLITYVYIPWCDEGILWWKSTVLFPFKQMKMSARWVMGDAVTSVWTRRAVMNACVPKDSRSNTTKESVSVSGNFNIFQALENK